MVGSPYERAMWMHGQPDCTRLFRFLWLDLDWCRGQGVHATVTDDERDQLPRDVLISQAPTEFTMIDSNLENELFVSFRSFRVSKNIVCM